MAETFEQVTPYIWRGSVRHMIYFVRQGKMGTGYQLWVETPIATQISTHKRLSLAVQAANKREGQ